MINGDMVTTEVRITMLAGSPPGTFRLEAIGFDRSTGVKILRQTIVHVDPDQSNLDLYQNALAAGISAMRTQEQ